MIDESSSPDLPAQPGPEGAHLDDAEPQPLVQPSPEPQPSEVVAPEQTNPTHAELMGSIESAPDGMALMAAVSSAEKIPYSDKVRLFSLAHERAVDLDDRGTALMYANRITAETNAQTATRMHEAVSGMAQSASQMKVAADQMWAAADLNHRVAHRPQ